MVVDPPPDGPEGMTLRQFINRIASVRDVVVPVVGAGLSVEAGGASGGDLLDALRTADGEEPDDPTELPSHEFFDIVDAHEERRGELWVRNVVAAEVGRHVLRPTPALMALAKAATGVVVTTNYDLAIEESAAAVGIPTLSVTLTEFEAALNDEFPGLVVLHLHGLASRPETLVLGSASYARILEDEAAQLVLRALAVRYHLLFVGHRLAAREAHIRRDIAWVAKAIARHEPRHAFLTDVTDVTLAEVDQSLTALMSETGVQVYVFSDPEGSYQAANRAAAVIAGPAAIDSEDLAPPFPAPDTHYRPMSVTQSEEFSTAQGRGAYLARTWQQGSVPATSLDAEENCLLLIAPAGHGKTRELLELSQRSRRPALFIRLSTVERPKQGETAEMTFRRWARSGQAPDTESKTPRLNEQRLRDLSYVFALDGLDEVPAADRSAVVEVINAVSTEFPQHRWVVSSRPLPLEDHLPHFASYTLIAEPTWLREYAASVGVTMSQLDAFLARAPGVADLITIPVYGTAVISQLRQGKEPPSSALDLVLSLADERVHALDEGWNPDQITLWLDRAALWLRLRGTAHLSAAELEQSGLHEDLELPAFDDLLNRLAVRALVTDLDGTINFPANIVSEARAARALLRAEEEGSALLREHVLIRLASEQSGDRHVTAIRASWVHLLELLLPHAPESWRDLIASVDPLLVARATTNADSVERRHEAINVIWNSYRERRVWLSRGFSSAEGDDRHAIERLVAASAPSDVIEQARAGTSDEDEPTLRKNALVVLAAALDEAELEPFVQTAIIDQHPVVRQEAAIAAMQRELRNLAPMMAAAACSDPEESAAQALLGAAVTLASPEEAVKYVNSAPARLQQREWSELARRMSRSELIALIAGPPPSLPLLEVVVGSTPRERGDWTAAQVAELAKVLLDVDIDDARYVTGVQDVLAQHPLAALLPWLSREPSDELHWEISSRVAALTDQDLDDAIAALEVSADAFRAHVEVGGHNMLSSAALAELRNHLASTAESRRNPQPLPWAAQRERQQHERQDALQARVAGDDWEGVLLTRAPRPEESLTEVQLRALDDWVTSRLHAMCQGGTLQAMAAADRIDAADHAVIEWARHRALAINTDDWLPLVLFAARWGLPEVYTWVREQAPTDASARVESALDEMTSEQVLSLPQLLPQPLAVSTSSAVLEAALLLEDENRSADAINTLINAGAAALVTSQAPNPPPRWMLVPLVAAGSCEAERALLEELVEDPTLIAKWPMRYANQWLHNVRCPESADAAYRALRSGLIAGRDSNDLEPLFEAWQRITDDAVVLSTYDQLSTDPEIPNGAFLFYNRQRVINALSERVALDNMDDVVVQNRITNSVPNRRAEPS